MNESDLNRNGHIDYTEFIASAMNVKQLLQKDERPLKAIFQQFDTDNSGKITAENLHFAFKKLGQTLCEDDIKMLIKQHDSSGNGTLEYAEVKQIFFDECAVI